MTKQPIFQSGWHTYERPSQGFMVDVWPFRMRDGRCELLLLHRVVNVDKGGARNAFWQGVSGGIESGEGAATAALREMQEETGITPRRIYTVDAIFQLYNAARDRIETVVVFAAEVDRDAEPTLSAEHDEWRWASVETAMQLLPFAPQRHAIERLVADIVERPEEAHRYVVDDNS